MSWSIWLAHHPPEEASRCTRVGGQAVCRRCLSAWPLALIVIGVSLTLPLPMAGLAELTALWLLPLSEYAAVHGGGLPYSPRRTWLLGPALGAALGRTLHRYLLAPFDPVTWAVLGLAGLIGGLSAVTYHLRVKNRESV